MLGLESKIEGTDPREKTDCMMQTYIRCTQDAHWDALTGPAQMAAYHFMASEVVREGDTYLYNTPGRRMLECKTLKAEPKSRIEATFEPKWEPGIPASRTVYLLIPEADHMKLVIEHYDLAFPVVPGEGVADGWERFASGLKTYLETGAATKFFTAGALA